MKDSQPEYVDSERRAKYIKANNERFSTRALVTLRCE